MDKLRPREAKPLVQGCTPKRQSQDSDPGLEAQRGSQWSPEKGLFGVCQGLPQNVPGGPLWAQRTLALVCQVQLDQEAALEAAARLGG